MRKILILVCALMTVNLVYGQKFLSDTSYVKFYSEAPVENIEAHNTDGTGVIDIETGQLVFSIPIKGFSFEKSLMEEHFNENYLESDKYPKATFTGKLQGWNGQSGKATAVGTMKMHGREQQIEVSGDVNVNEDRVEISAVFPIKLEDYKIKIPKAVFYNIAEVVEVTVFFSYAPYEKN